MQNQYVYLIREREFIRLNEDTYKIGKTTQTPNSRLTGYPKGSQVVLFQQVNDCTLIENVIMKVFKNKFIQMTEYGIEYFKGDGFQMRNTINDIIIKEVIDTTMAEKIVNEMVVNETNKTILKTSKGEEIIQNVFNNTIEQILNKVSDTLLSEEIPNNENINVPKIINIKHTSNKINVNVPKTQNNVCDLCGKKFFSYKTLWTHKNKKKNPCTPPSLQHETTYNINKIKEMIKNDINKIKQTLTVKTI